MRLFSSQDYLIENGHLKPGPTMCDKLNRPPETSEVNETSVKRSDVL